jgi:filamentous hemagglutinin family protein
MVHLPSARRPAPRLSLLSLLIFTAYAAASVPPTALPSGGQVVAGQASLASNGSQLTVNQASSKTIIDWTRFDIGALAAVRFNQPNASAVALNEVLSSDPSQIFGRLSANGEVFLVNPAGIVFGPGAQVNTGALLVSTLSIADADFMGGRYSFQRKGAAGSIVNQGSLRSDAGWIALLAPQIVNEGVVRANLGTVAFAAGDSVMLSFEGSGGLQLAVAPSTIRTLIDNRQLVQADGGVVWMTSSAASMLLGSMVTSSGRVEADTIGVVKGQVVLSAGEGTATLTGNGRISAAGGGSVALLGRQVGLFDRSAIDASGASGGGTVLIGGNFHGAGPEPDAEAAIIAAGARISADALGRGNGGKVAIWSDSATQMDGVISARGGPQGGDGGQVETSSHGRLAVSGHVDASAPAGKAGLWLLDPYDTTISNNADASDGSAPNFGATASGANVNAASIQTALNAGTSVTVSTGAGGGEVGNITVYGTADPGGAVNISKTSGGAAGLTLQAAGSIVFDSGAAIRSSSGPLNLTLNSANDNGTATAAGAVVLNGATINLDSGNVVIGGGPNPLTGMAVAVGPASNQAGVIVNASSISTTGNLTVNGQAAPAGTVGVLIVDSQVSSASMAVNTPDTLRVAGVNNATGLNSSSSQTITAGTLAVSGSLSGSNSGATISSSGGQLITVGSGGIALTGGEGNNNGAEINQTGATSAQTFVVSGPLQLTGGGNASSGTGNGVAIWQSGSGLQSISANSLSLIAGGGLSGASNGAAIRVTSGSQASQQITIGSGGLNLQAGTGSGGGDAAYITNDNDAVTNAQTNATQTVTVAGGITITAGSGFAGPGLANNSAGINQSATGPSASQSVAATGSIVIAGGSGGIGNSAYISSAAPTQSVTAGSLSLIGGEGTNNGLSINQNAPGGAQTIAVTGALTVSGGGISSNGSGNSAGISQSGSGLQAVSAGTITVIGGGGTSGVNNAGYINVNAGSGGSQSITAGTGGLILTGGTGSGGGNGAGINDYNDSHTATQTNSTQVVTVNGGGLTITGGTGYNATTYYGNLAGISQSSSGPGATQAISATGAVVLAGGSNGNGNQASISNGSPIQTLNAGSLSLIGGSTGTNNTAYINQAAVNGAQTIAVTGALVLTAGGNAASDTGNNTTISQAGSGLQQVSANAISLTGGGGAAGANNLAYIAISTGATGSQEITAGSGGISLNGGSGSGGNNWVQIVDAADYNASTQINSSQTITVNGGGLSVTGGSGSLASTTYNNAAIYQTATGAQAVQSVSATGAITLTGGSGFNYNNASIQSYAPVQSIAAGSLSLVGGEGSNNAAFIGQYGTSAVGSQTVAVANALAITAGGILSNGSGNFADIEQYGAGSQQVSANSIVLTGGGGVSGAGNSAAIAAGMTGTGSSQTINAGPGGLTLLGGTGSGGANPAAVVDANDFGQSTPVSVSQTVTTTGGISVIGGSGYTGSPATIGDSNSAYIIQWASGASATQSVAATGGLAISGGGGGANNRGLLGSYAPTQNLVAGLLTLQGGEGSSNSAEIAQNNAIGSQSIAVNGALTASGGGTVSSGFDNYAAIEQYGAGLQQVSAASISLVGGGGTSGGADQASIIVGKGSGASQQISVGAGGLTLSGGTGSAGANTAGIGDRNDFGAATSTDSTQTVTVGGSMVIVGGSGFSGTATDVTRTNSAGIVQWATGANAAQSVTVTGSVSISGGAGGANNQGVIQSFAPVQNVSVGSLTLQGGEGSANSVVITQSNIAGSQTIGVAGALTAAGGGNTSNGNGNLAEIQQYGSGLQQVSSNSLDLTGGGGASGSGNYAGVVVEQGASASQQILVGAGGMRLTGGSGSGGQNYAEINDQTYGPSTNSSQLVNVTGGGITLTGGSGTNNDADIYQGSAGPLAAQAISATGAIVLSGGSGGSPGTPAYNYAWISSSAPTQVVTAGSLQVSAGPGFGNGANLNGLSQAINVAGALSLSGSAPSGSLGMSPVDISSSGAQQVSAGSMQLVGGEGPGSYASIVQNGATGAQAITVSGALVMAAGGGLSGGSGNYADIQQNGSGLQQVAANAITLTGGGGATGSRNHASIETEPGSTASQLVIAGAGGLTLVGGSGSGGANSAGVSVLADAASNGNTNASQTIVVGGGGSISLMGGSAASGAFLNGATNNQAGIQSLATGPAAAQIITVAGAGNINLTGGVSGSGNGGVIFTTSPVQAIAMGNGAITLQGGAGNAGENGAAIYQQAAGRQTLSFTAPGGSLTVTGGSGVVTPSAADGNFAMVNTSAGNQTIAGVTAADAPAIAVNGGTGGFGTATVDLSNWAKIKAGAGAQSIIASTIQLTGGASGTDDSATIQAPVQTVQASSLALDGGGASGAQSGARMGGSGGFNPGPTDLSLTTTGDITLTGGSGAGAALGANRVGGVGTTITINAGGNLSLNAGSGHGARIGGSPVALAGGDVVVNANGAITINGNASAASGIYTTGNVSLNANGAITQNSFGAILAAALSTTSTAGTSLPGANGIASFNASNSSSDGVSLVDAASLLSVGAVNNPNGPVTLLNAGPINVAGPINGQTVQITTTGAGNGLTLSNAAVRATGNGGSDGAVTLQSADSILAQDSTISSPGGVTLNAGSTVSQSAAAAIDAATLASSSVGGAALAGANAVASLSAVNAGGGALSFANTGVPLTLLAVRNAAGAVAISNAGPVQVAGTVSGTSVQIASTGAGNAVSLASGAHVQSAGDVGLVAGGQVVEDAGATVQASTLSTTTGGGMALGGVNTVAGYAMNNSGSGTVALTGTGAPLVLQAVSNPAGAVTVTNPGAITVAGALSGASVTIVSGGSLDSISTGSISASGTPASASVRAGAQIQAAPAATAAGNVVLSAAGSITLAAPVTASGSVAIDFGQAGVATFLTSAPVSAGATASITSRSNGDTFDFTAAPAMSATLVGAGAGDTLIQSGGQRWALNGSSANAGASRGLVWTGIGNLTDTGAGVFYMGTQGSVTGALAATAGTLDYSGYTGVIGYLNGFPDTGFASASGIAQVIRPGAGASALVSQQPAPPDLPTLLSTISTPSLAQPLSYDAAVSVGAVVGDDGIAPGLVPGASGSYAAGGVPAAGAPGAFGVDAATPAGSLMADASPASLTAPAVQGPAPFLVAGAAPAQDPAQADPSLINLAEATVNNLSAVPTGAGPTRPPTAADAAPNGNTANSAADKPAAATPSLTDQTALPAAGALGAAPTATGTAAATPAGVGAAQVPVTVLTSSMPPGVEATAAATGVDAPAAQPGAGAAAAGPVGSALAVTPVAGPVEAGPMAGATTSATSASPTASTAAATPVSSTPDAAPAVALPSDPTPTLLASAAGNPVLVDRTASAMAVPGNPGAPRSPGNAADPSGAYLAGTGGAFHASTDTGVDAAERLLDLAEREAELKARRRALYKVAIETLEHNRNAADMPLCSAGVTEACIAPLVKPIDANLAAPTEIGHKRALLIGNQKYRAPIQQLDTPATDVRALATLLRDRLGYEVTTVENGTKAMIAQAFNDLAARTKADESVLIFYAGHGYELEDGSAAGFWLPVDASASSPANWISNDDITRLLGRIPANQILLVSDSCFSGLLTKQQSLDAPLTARKSALLGRRAVVAMSSGDDEPVADWGIAGHSVFAFYLLQALGEVADYSPISLIYDRLRFNVQHAAPQTPQLGGVKSAGHVSQANYLVEPK